LADKNAYRIFAGGNHSWVLLDEFVPMRKAYRAPSPLAGDIEKNRSKSPDKDNAGQVQLTNQARNGKGKPLETTQQISAKAEIQRKTVEQHAK